MSSWTDSEKTPAEAPSLGALRDGAEWEEAVAHALETVPMVHETFPMVDEAASATREDTTPRLDIMSMLHVDGDEELDELDYSASSS